MKFSFLHPRGSALLVTLLLMSVLMILGFGFGKLIIDNIRLEYNVVNAGKAYFAAEAGIEEGLFLVDRKLPGFETTVEDDTVEDDVDGDGMNDFQYSIQSLSSSAEGSVPCNYDNSGDTFWHRLKLNDSLTLPLFRDNGSGQEEKIKNFRVYYYLDPWPEVDASVQELPVLRWKILGLTPSGETQALSDYVPVKVDYNTAEKPTHFGTKLAGEAGEITDGDEAQFRDCSGETCVFYEQYLISTFLENHQSNFFVLSNVPNLPLPDGGDDFTLFLRIAEDGEALVCNTVRIESDGVPRDLGALGQQYRQNINVDMALDDFLPVFDFALYRTER